MARRDKEYERVRLTEKEKEMIVETSKATDIPKSEIIRNGMMKECKKLLKDMEKGSK